MEENSGMREYVQSQIRDRTEALGHWLKRRGEVDEEIEAIRKDLAALEGMLGYMGRGEEGEPMPDAGRAEEAKPYAAKSITAGALEVLRRAGRPLHASRIWAELEEGGKVLESPRPIVSVASAILRDPRFVSLGKNTYALKEAIEDEEKNS